MRIQMMTWSAMCGFMGCTGVEPDETMDTPNEDSGIQSPGDDTASDAPGCIHIDGAGDYPTIQAAIDAAADGSTISICAMESQEVELLIDKALNIEGPGIDSLHITAPINANAITITADQVSISGLSIESTRNGILIAGADSVQLTDLLISDVGNWAISTNESTDVSLDRLTLERGGYGAIQVTGGSLSVFNSTLTANIGYGVYATDGATVSLTDSTFDGTTPSDLKDVTDGIGLYAEEDSVVQLTRNVWTDNHLAHVLTEQSDLNISGDQMTGGANGIWSTYGAVELHELQVTDAARYGIFASTTDPVSIHSTTVSGDLEATIAVGDEDWGSDEQGYAGTGIMVTADAITIQESTVEGYNGAGILLNEMDDGTASLQSLTLRQNGRHGLVIYGLDTTADAVHVQGLIETVDQGDELCNYVDRFVGVLSVSNRLTWTGGEITDNAGYGLTGNEASLDISGTTIRGNRCAGIMDYFGTSVVQDNDFSQSGADALTASMVAYYSGGSVISNNRFTDAQLPYEQVTESVSDDQTIRIVYDVTQGFDVYARETPSVQIQNNTFLQGTNGIYLSGSEGSIENNQWTDYLQRPIGVYDSEGVDIIGNQISGFGYYGIYCSQAQVDIDTGTFEEGGAFTYDYDTYIDDVFQGTSSNAEIGYAVYGYNCSASIEQSTFTDLAGSALRSRTYGTDDITELNELEINGTGLHESATYSALYFYVSSGSNDVRVENVHISNVQVGNGLELLSSSEPLRVDVRRMSVDQSADEGIYLYGEGVVASMTAIEISKAGTEGVQSSYATIRLEDSVIQGSTTSGLYLLSTTANVLRNEITQNGTYGMVCSSATIDSCLLNDLSNNSSGEHDGCPTTCSSTESP